MRRISIVEDHAAVREQLHRLRSLGEGVNVAQPKTTDDTPKAPMRPVTVERVRPDWQAADGTVWVYWR